MYYLSQRHRYWWWISITLWLCPIFRGHLHHVVAVNNGLPITIVILWVREFLRFIRIESLQPGRCCSTRCASCRKQLKCTNWLPNWQHFTFPKNLKQTWPFSNSFSIFIQLIYFLSLMNDRCCVRDDRRSELQKFRRTWTQCTPPKTQLVFAKAAGSYSHCAHTKWYQTLIRVFLAYYCLSFWYKILFMICNFYWTQHRITELFFGFKI